MQPMTTESEKEILDMLLNEFLTIKQIAYRRQTSVQAVYKIIKRLKEKGVLGMPKNQRFKIQCTRLLAKNFKGKKIRLHGEEFNIKILQKSKEYEKTKDQQNFILIENHTIRLYRDSIEVYSGKSFYGKTAQETTSQSIKYWWKFFQKLENYFNIILIKDRKHNIKLVKSHYAELNNELAKEANEKKYNIKVKAPEDQKTWLSIDKSFNINEAETIHPETSKRDMEEAILPFFNDLRKNNPPNLTELTQVLKQSLEVNKETASGLNAVVQIINLLFKDYEPEPPKDQSKLDYFG